MMNYHLKNLPERTKKTREKGLTMVIDKGSSINECKNLIESSGEFIDIVKFGWSTSLLTKDLVKKINMFKKAEISVYFDVLKKYNLKYAEVSDGSIEIPHKRKCEYISELSKHVTVLSEVGSKDTRKIIDNILNNKIDEAVTMKTPIFNLLVPKALDGIAADILDPRNSWGNSQLWEAKAKELAKLFI